MPADGDHYTPGEQVLIALTFDRSVSIEPKPAIKSANAPACLG